jgi:hypothetical protein
MSVWHTQSVSSVFRVPAVVVMRQCCIQQKDRKDTETIELDSKYIISNHTYYVELVYQSVYGAQSAIRFNAENERIH